MENVLEHLTGPWPVAGFVLCSFLYAYKFSVMSSKRGGGKDRFKLLHAFIGAGAFILVVCVFVLYWQEANQGAGQANGATVGASGEGAIAVKSKGNVNLDIPAQRVDSLSNVPSGEHKLDVSQGVQATGNRAVAVESEGDVTIRTPSHQ